MKETQLQVPRTARRGIVTVGNFDGVHRGHQRMLCSLKQIAAAQKAPAVVMTFDPHPLAVLRSDVSVPRLTTVSRRCELLRNAGADEVIVLPASPELLQMTADEFFRDILVRQLQAAGVVEGPNFRFGRDRQGDIQRLEAFCREAGLIFQVIDPVVCGDRMISSSRIRGLLKEGRVLEAVSMIGRGHRISGTVSRGAGRGGELGFPTANIDDVPVMLPRHGVYAGTAQVDGQSYVAAVSIGPNPTFGDDQQKVECHLVGFSGTLYGQVLEVDLLTEIRSLCSFTSAADLKQQIARDVRQCQMRVRRLTSPVYKICQKTQWQEALTTGAFHGSEVDRRDGYIHCSTAGQVAETARKHFSGQDDLMLVAIDPLRVGPALKWEPSRGGDLFPHLYGPLRVDDCLGAEPLPWHAGGHRFPDSVAVSCDGASCGGAGPSDKA